jgi:hypothetical protein
MKKLLSIFLFLVLCWPVYGATVSGRPCPGGAACTPSYGSELATVSNATDDSGGSEADATTGWTGSTLATFDSVTTAPKTGTYHITAISDGASDRFYRTLTLTEDTIYKYSFWVRHNGSGGDWKCGETHYSSGTTFVNPFTAALTSADTTYTQYSGYFRHVGDAGDTYFMCWESGDNTGGIYLDDFSFKTATLCYGAEKYTTANAMSTSAYEANDNSTGLNAVNTTLSVITEGCSEGSYCLRAVMDGTANARFYIDLNGVLEDGKKYLIRYKIKHSGSGDLARCNFASTTSWSGTNTKQLFISSLATSWTTFASDFTYSATTRYWGCQEYGASNNSDFQIDALSIKEIVSE